ncbi:growth hormone secretagogue receptor type 1-like [Watersipora subatra]|uniref:growth hormone secretagogue receptor type 1-like n=1 Tax=Watersipora subatra TaxID=2589382 RepID=UPI00355B334A
MNATDNFTGLTVPYQTVALISSYFILVTIVGVLLNLLTIFALALGSNISKEVRIQLINLAAADLAMAALFPSTMMSDSILFLPFRGSLSWCAVSFFVSASAAHASLLCNAAISLERVVIVYFPFKATGYTKTKKYLVVVLIWTCAAVPQISTARHSVLINRPDNTTLCEIGIVRTLTYYQWLEALQSIIPTAIIVTSYTLVLVKLCVRKKSKLVLKHSSSADSNTIVKLQVMLSVDAFLSLVTLLPHDLYYAARQSSGLDLSTYSVDVLTTDVVLAALTCTNAFSTPVVYLIFNKYFRMDVKKLFRKICCYNTATKSSQSLEKPEQMNSSELETRST